MTGNVVWREMWVGGKCGMGLSFVVGCCKTFVCDRL